MSDGDAESWDRDFVAQYLVGVIDLCRGQAVHAVKGDRAAYAPVPCVQGDPLRLVRAYADFGMRQIYVADLDAIQLRTAPSETLSELIEALHPDTELLIDIGWRGNETSSTIDLFHLLAKKYPRTSWIAASETAVSLEAVAAFCEVIPTSRVLLGLEYQNEQWMAKQVTESQWLEANTSSRSLGGAVVLDLRTVGSGTGPTTSEKCRLLKTSFPSWQIVSGGGIRSQRDAIELVDSGCDRCLVATAIHASLR